MLITPALGMKPNINPQQPKQHRLWEFTSQHTDFRVAIYTHLEFVVAFVEHELVTEMPSKRHHLGCDCNLTGRGVTKEEASVYVYLSTLRSVDANSAACVRRTKNLL